MRALGYPRLISMENFRKPNFELVSDILYWMVKLYDPETSISDRVEFENERVEFLTSIAALMAAKARLKLNTKKLYASDGRAVQELLKLATLLYKAVKSTDNKPEDDSVPAPVKVQDVKTSRNLASDITQGGAKLYDLLATEANDRQERSRALRFLDTAATASEGSREYQFIERSLRDIIETTKQTVEDMRKECEELEADEKNLDNKIKKKQEELERTEKRLRSLDNVRPQFMDEVDKLEKELQRHYEVYIEKYRNLDYLEHELEKYHRSEEERKEQQERRLKKMRERLLKEEVELLRGGRDQAREDDDDRGGGPGTSRAVGGNFGRNRGKDLDSSEGEGSDGEDLSGDGGGGSDDEELSVGSRGRGGGGGGGGMMKMGGGAGGPGGRGGMMMGAAGGGAGGGGGAGRMRGGMGGSEPDSDEFLDDDDDDEEEDGDDDGGDDDSGSDEHF